MFQMRIANIELTMPAQEFQDALQACVDNYSTTMNYALKPVSTKHGKNMYKLSIDNGNNSIVEVVAERDDASGDVCFHPLKLSNMNESFYNVRYDNADIAGQDEDPCIFFCYAMNAICSNNKGSFAYIDPNGNAVITKDGTQKRGVTVALVDKDGTVYSCAGAKSVKGAADDVEFTVKKPIGEWLSENHEIAQQIAPLSITDKMNAIGKHLIQARLNDEIDSDEFMDIFCQAGIIGFTEKSVLNIYKLLM